jgi:sugar phosphate isomerase/epimerase
VKDQLRQGRELVAEYRLLDDAITEAQRGYLHGVVLTEIAQFARPNGQQYPMKVWKEHFRSEFLGFDVVTCINPFTGRKSRRRVRVSTEDLGVRRMAEYIDRVIAFAATELGVVVSQPLPPELRPQRRHRKQETVDADTGEILEVA